MRGRVSRFVRNFLLAEKKIYGVAAIQLAASNSPPDCWIYLSNLDTKKKAETVETVSAFLCLFDTIDITYFHFKKTTYFKFSKNIVRMFRHWALCVLRLLYRIKILFHILDHCTCFGICRFAAYIPLSFFLSQFFL